MHEMLQINTVNFVKNPYAISEKPQFLSWLAYVFIDAP